MTALAEGLGTEYFDITYTDKPDSYIQYYNDVFEHRSGKIPFMYGSYEIYSASQADQYYEFVSLVNLTSIDSAGLYPNFMYESILKTATDNQDFKFKVRSTPYPPTRFILDRVVVSATNSVLIQIAISYGIILSGIATYIVLERTNGLKHLQAISGMRRSSYWLANFFMDFFKLMITILLTIILFFAFQLEYNNAWVIFLLLPLGVLPFTYFTTYLFNSSSSASTFTMFLHILTVGILTTTIYTLRLVPVTMDTGDKMHEWFRVIPTYMLGSSIYCDTQCQGLSDARKSPLAEGDPLEPEVWAMSNLSMDVIMMFVHMAVWSIFILLIEIGLFRCLRARPNVKVLDEA